MVPKILLGDGVKKLVAIKEIYICPAFVKYFAFFLKNKKNCCEKFKKTLSLRSNAGQRPIECH